MKLHHDMRLTVVFLHKRQGPRFAKHYRKLQTTLDFLNCFHTRFSTAIDKACPGNLQLSKQKATGSEDSATKSSIEDAFELYTIYNQTNCQTSRYVTN